MDITNFKKILSNFATGITVISFAGDKKDIHYGMTVNSFSSVSLNPALVLFCLQKNSLKHSFFHHFVKVNINILSAEQKNISNYFAQKGLHLFNKDIINLSNINSLPVINGCLGYLECEVKDIFSAGDHDIILCSVLNANLIDDNAKALTYFRSNYGMLG